MKETKPELTRRNLLRLGWLGILGSGLLMLQPVSEYLTNNEDDLQASIVSLPVTQVVGRTWSHVPNTRVWVKKSGAGFAALVATCTHLG